MVIPNFTSMFEEMGTDLPLATRIMVALSDFVIYKWWLLIIIVAAIVVRNQGVQEDTVRRTAFCQYRT